MREIGGKSKWFINKFVNNFCNVVRPIFGFKFRLLADNNSRFCAVALVQEINQNPWSPNSAINRENGLVLVWFVKYQIK